MKKILLSIFILCCISSHGQVIKKDLYCSFTFSFGNDELRLEKVVQSRLSGSLPDTLSDYHKLIYSGGSVENFPDIMEKMIKLGWKAEFTNSISTDWSQYVIYVFKKSISYTLELLEQIRKKDEKEAKKYKYFPD